MLIILPCVQPFTNTLVQQVIKTHIYRDDVMQNLLRKEFEVKDNWKYLWTLYAVTKFWPFSSAIILLTRIVIV